jgi:hypothetical protein
MVAVCPAPQTDAADIDLDSFVASRGLAPFDVRDTNTTHRYRGRTVVFIRLAHVLDWIGRIHSCSG